MSCHPMDFEDEERRRELLEWLRRNLGEEKEEIKIRRFTQKNRMRNRSCPCGSGRKFKKCCWRGL